MSEHTPGPWWVESWADAGNGVAIRGADGGPICRVDGVAYWFGATGVGVRTAKVRDANAAFIVQACNSHDELVGALAELVTLKNAKDIGFAYAPGDGLDIDEAEYHRRKGPAWAAARAALAKARGEA